VHARRLARYAAIARERECESASAGGTFYRRDEWLWSAPHRDHQIAHAPLSFNGVGGGAAQRITAAAILLLEIESGAERASGATHDHDAGFSIVAESAKEVFQLIDH